MFVCAIEIAYDIAKFAIQALGLNCGALNSDDAEKSTAIHQWFSLAIFVHFHEIVITTSRHK